MPDDQLVDAVIANLMAKLDPHHPDPYRTIPMLSHGRCVVYSVWLLCRELDNAGFEELLESPSSAFCALGADGFDTLGAVRCAEAVRAALRTEEEEELAERTPTSGGDAGRTAACALCGLYPRQRAGLPG